MDSIQNTDWMAYCQRQREATAAQIEIYKAAVFAVLKETGITRISVTFNGEGDSGQIEDVSAFTGDNAASLPDAGLAAPATGTLKDGIETLCYACLEKEQSGWENNDGAYGEFEIDVAESTISLEFNGRYISVDSHGYEF